MKRLASLELALWIILGLSVWLAMGVVLAWTRPMSLAMQSMDHGLLMDWLISPAWSMPGGTLVAVWFLGLCLGVGLLVVNLTFCTLTRLLPRLKTSAKLHSRLLFLAHVLMFLILFGHLSQMVMGFKEEGIHLRAGESRELPGGRIVRVEEVSYVNDPDLLNLPYRQSQRVLLRSTFDREANRARVSLWRDGELQARQEMRILEPMRTGGVRVTLTDFHRPGAKGTREVGVVLTASSNPLTNLFFGAYIAWIAVYLCLAAQAWSPAYRLPSLNGTEEENAA